MKNGAPAAECVAGDMRSAALSSALAASSRANCAELGGISRAYREDQRAGAATRNRRCRPPAA